MSKHEQMTLLSLSKWLSHFILVEKRFYYVGPFIIIIIEMNDYARYTQSVVYEFVTYVSDMIHRRT